MGLNGLAHSDMHPYMVYPDAAHLEWANIIFAWRVEGEEGKKKRLSTVVGMEIALIVASSTQQTQQQLQQC